MLNQANVKVFTEHAERFTSDVRDKRLTHDGAAALLVQHTRNARRRPGKFGHLAGQGTPRVAAQDRRRRLRSRARPPRIMRRVSSPVGHEASAIRKSLVSLTMPMSQASVIELFKDRLLPVFVNEVTRVDALDKWLKSGGADVPLPRKANAEHKALAALARTPLLPLVVTNTAQALFVDGYKAPDETQDAAGWDTWQANDMDARQSALHRGALGHALSYATSPARHGRQRPTLHDPWRVCPSHGCRLRRPRRG